MDLRKETVLVTGADGFIGSHLAEHLTRSGVKVRALVLYNSFNSCGWLDTLPADVRGAMEIIPGDIRDEALLEKALTSATVCFHLAALISIPFSYEAASLYAQTNIQGTLNILNAARRTGLKKLLVTSTSEVYGTAQEVPISEQHPIHPQSPYAASKVAADALASAYFHSYGLPVTIARPFNTFGPRQSARAVIPTIITQLLQEKPQIHLGSLHPTRDFCFVKDTITGMIALTASDETSGETVNIGSDFEISIADTVKEIAGIIGKTPDVITNEERVRPKKSEVLRLWANTHKLRSITNWEPHYQGVAGFRRGLEETIDWFKKCSWEINKNTKTYVI